MRTLIVGGLFACVVAGVGLAFLCTPATPSASAPYYMGDEKEVRDMVDRYFADQLLGRREELLPNFPSCRSYKILEVAISHQPLKVKPKLLPQDFILTDANALVTIRVDHSGNDGRHVTNDVVIRAIFYKNSWSLHDRVR